MTAIEDIIHGLLWALESCEKGLCDTPATWDVDFGGVKRAPRCDAHLPDQRPREERWYADDARRAVHFVAGKHEAAEWAKNLRSPSQRKGEP